MTGRDVAVVIVLRRRWTTFAELREELGIAPHTTPARRLQRAMSSLVQLGVVETRSTSGQPCREYRVGDDASRVAVDLLRSRA